MDQNEQFFPDFWQQFHRVMYGHGFPPDADLSRKNVGRKVQSWNLSSINFLPFAVPGELGDVPHIGYKADKGVVFFYLPRAHWKGAAVREIVRSSNELQKAGEKARFHIMFPKREIILLIEIPPVQTKADPASQATVMLAFKKMLKLLLIAQKALPDYKLR